MFGRGLLLDFDRTIKVWVGVGSMAWLTAWG